MNLSEEKRQIKVGLLFLVLLQACLYLVYLFVFPILPDTYLSLVDAANKGILLIVTILLMTYTVRRWKWNLHDLGKQKKSK